MKKRGIIILGAMTVLSFAFLSCNEGVSTKPVLKTSSDTLSYAIGTEYYVKTGLRMYLSTSELNLLQDTSAISSQYKKKIEETLEDTSKDALRKEMRYKIDSIEKINHKILIEVARGIKDAAEASTQLKKAYIKGLTVGMGVYEGMLGSYTQQFFGSKDLADEIDKDLFYSGLIAAVSGSEFAIEDPELVVAEKSDAYLQQQHDEKIRKIHEQYAENAAKGQEFLEKNKEKNGVIVLPSGLQYKAIRNGNGPKPKISDTVKVHYTGQLVNGVEFDNSHKRGKPVIFGVSNMLKGWSEVLQLMPVGSKWIVYIPEDLAYGTVETGPIEPLSTLIFEIELLGIENQKK